MTGKDLTQEPPRSAYERIAGFAILPRTIDKCRAFIEEKNGDYHFNCPLDKTLFEFKGINADEFKAYVATDASDEDIGQWVKKTGTPKTDEEIKEWSDSFKNDFSYSKNPEKRDWFRGECERLDLDPENTTLFDYLDADDQVTFKQ